MPDEATSRERIELVVDAPSAQLRNPSNGLSYAITLLRNIQREQEKVISNYNKMMIAAGAPGGGVGATVSGQRAATQNLQTELNNRVAIVKRFYENVEAMENEMARKVQTTTKTGPFSSKTVTETRDKEGNLGVSDIATSNNYSAAERSAQKFALDEKKRVYKEYLADVKRAGVENQRQIESELLRSQNVKSAQKKTNDWYGEYQKDKDRLANQMADAREARQKDRSKGQNEMGRQGELQERQRFNQYEANIREQGRLNQQLEDSAKFHEKSERASSRAAKQRYNDYQAEIREHGNINQQRESDLKAQEKAAAARAKAAAPGTARGDSAVAGRNIVDNIKHISAWAAGVFVLYVSLRLAENAMRSLLDRGMQMARLTQVIRGVPDADKPVEARRITDDVQKMAAMNGRSSDEAIESAIRWARLGYTRLQIQEAVRVSLVAANVAEISAAEATERLSAMTQVYGLRVSELNSVLGAMNQISNTFNVTNKEMFNGLSKVASVAKEAGLSLFELQGILGGAMGTTGQPGAQIANALKSAIGSVSNPQTQETMRKQFGVETTTKGEELQNFSDILSNMYVQYQRMSDAERQTFLFGTVGKNQASRMAAILDSYVRGQVLAIQGLKNLNSAEQENALITGTLKSQVQGVVTEWDRFVTKQGTNGPAQAFTEITKAFHALLSVMNAPVMNKAVTAIGVLLTAVAAKLVLVQSEMMKTGAKGGFLASSWSRLGESLSGFSNAAKKVALDRYVQQVGVSAYAGYYGAGVGTAAAYTGSQKAMDIAKNAQMTTGEGVIAVIISLFRGLVRIAPWVALAVVAFKGVGYALDAAGITGSKFEAKASASDRGIEDANKSAQAERNKSRLFSTLRRSIENQTDPNQKISDLSLAATTLGLDEQKTKELQHQLELYVRQGDELKIQAFLENQSGTARKRHQLELQKEFELMQDRDAMLKGELARLERSKGPLRVSPFDRDQKIKDVQERMKNNSAAMLDNRAAEADEQLSNQANVAAQYRSKVEFKAYTASQSGLLRSIDSIYNATPGDSASDRLDKQAAAELVKSQLLQKQITDLDVKKQAIETEHRLSQDEAKNIEALIENDRKRIAQGKSRNVSYSLDAIEERQATLDRSKRIPSTNLIDQEINEAKDRKADAESKLQEANDRALRAAAQQEDRQRLTLSLEGSRIGGFSVGDGEAQQAANQAAALEKRIAVNQKALETAKTEVEQQRIRNQLQADALALQNNYEHGLQRMIDLAKEDKQLMIDKRREQERSLLEAGPGELLRKLAINRLARNGRMDSGGFFALSSEGRREALSLPQNDPQHLANQRNLKEYGRRGYGRTEDQLFEAGERLRGIRAQARAGIPQTDLINAAAKSTIDALSGFRTALIDTTKELRALIPARGVPANASDPRNNGPWNTR